MTTHYKLTLSSKPSSNEKNVVANVSIGHNGELQIIRDFDRRGDVDKHMIMDETFDEKAAKFTKYLFNPNNHGGWSKGLALQVD